MKLDIKSKRCIFLGYGEDEFGYHLWDSITKKVIWSRDVVFNEKSFSSLQFTHSSSKNFIQYDLSDNGIHRQNVPWVTFHPSTFIPSIMAQLTSSQNSLLCPIPQQSLMSPTPLMVSTQPLFQYCPASTSSPTQT